MDIHFYWFLMCYGLWQNISEGNVLRSPLWLSHRLIWHVRIGWIWVFISLSNKVNGSKLLFFYRTAWLFLIFVTGKRWIKIKVNLFHHIRASLKTRNVAFPNSSIQKAETFYICDLFQIWIFYFVICNIIKIDLFALFLSSIVSH